MRRLHSIHRHRAVHSVIPGKYKVADGKSVIRSYIGSTLVACIYDPHLGIGGLANFIVPGTADAAIEQSEYAEFGIAYIEYIIADVVKFGGNRKKLRAKLFGLTVGAEHNCDHIQANEQFIEQYMRKENFPVEVSDLKADSFKEIVFFPERGSAYVRRVTDRHIIQEIQQRESEYILAENASVNESTTCVLF